MPILKKILHLIFSAFLVWQTYMLVERLTMNQPLEFTDKLLDAVFLNVFVTGIFTIVYSFPIHKALPEKYYTIKNPVLLKRIGQIIQIDVFKKLLTHTIWRKQQNKKHFFNGHRSGFADLETATRKSEFGHFAGFCVVTVLTVVIGAQTHTTVVILIFVINLLFNFYPFMLQRFHRMRLHEVIGRLSE